MYSEADRAFSWRLALFAAAPAPALAVRVYVTNEKGNSISVIDSDKQQVIQTVPAGRRPRGITISPDGKLLYVCASDENGVDVFDVATMKLVRTLQSGPDPEQFALNRAGNPLYIANEDNAQVTVLDLVKNQILAQVPVGVEPEGMAISPDGELLVTPPRPPTWRISSTPRPISCSTACWSTRGRASPFSTAGGPSSG